MKQQFLSIIETLQKQFGTNNWFLPTPVTARLSPHTPPFEVHGLCVSPKGELFLMSSEGEWNKLEVDDVNASKLIQSIYKRIRYVFHSQMKEEREVA